MSFVPSIIICCPNGSTTPAVTGCPFPADMLKGGNYAAEIVYDGGSSEEAQLFELTPETPGGIKWIELSFLGKLNGTAEVMLLQAKDKDKALAGLSFCQQQS